MTPADQLRAAAAKLRDLATRTTTTLERHEVQWTDLTIGDTAAKAKARPMVWSQYAATMGPPVGLGLADLLDDQADGDDEGVINPWALAAARAVLGILEATP
ncbi:hypothetical protein [Streptomyces sp. NPDC020377]|uniref:hypothetical protein n=1 Tax=Streptomyces sp. NPDC020377 TaxID=3365070 RepID=UPI00379030F8